MERSKNARRNYFLRDFFVVFFAAFLVVFFDFFAAFFIAMTCSHPLGDDNLMKCTKGFLSESRR